MAEDDGEPPPSTEDLKRAFDEADYDGGGTIDSGEFLKLMMLIKSSGGGGDGGGQEAQDSKSKGRFGFWKRRLRSRSSAAKEEKKEKKEKTKKGKKTKQGRKKKFNTFSSGTASGESKDGDVASDEDTQTAPSFSARRRTNTQDVEEEGKQKSKKEHKAFVAKGKKPLSLKKRAKLRAVFEAMDDDHSGSIDLDELKVTLTPYQARPVLMRERVVAR